MYVNPALCSFKNKYWNDTVNTVYKKENCRYVSLQFQYKRLFMKLQ